MPENIILLRENVHRAVHTLYSDATPIQRLRRTLEADKTTLQAEVYNILSSTLERFERRELEVYKPKIFNTDTFIKRMKHG